MARLRQIVPLLLSFTLLLLALWAITHELKAYRFQDVVENLRLISTKRQLGAMTLTVFSYLSMTGYDWLGFLYAGHHLPLVRILRTSFISHALGNTVGFTIVSGTAVRYRYYAANGLSGMAIAKIIAFTHLGFWLGILTIGGVVFIVNPLRMPTLLKIPLTLTNVRPLGLVLIGIVALYFVFIALGRQSMHWKGKQFTLPAFDLSLGLIAFSVLDWGLAAGVLYSLLPEKFPLSFMSFFGIYVFALTAGVVSTVPGGLGVFETVILLLRPESVSAPEILGSLLAYRGIYFALPLLVATVLILGYEWQNRSR